MKEIVLTLADILRDEGHKVDAFCDSTNGRISFNWSELIKIMKTEGTDVSQIDAIEMMKHWRVKDAFEEDKKWINWADVLILVMPCGRSAHLEAGYAVGKGKKMYILGGFKKGEFDTMYGFADGMYDHTKTSELIEVLGNEK